jgi:hypothetical protein
VLLQHVLCCMHQNYHFTAVIAVRLDTWNTFEKLTPCVFYFDSMGYRSATRNIEMVQLFVDRLVQFWNLENTKKGKTPIRRNFCDIRVCQVSPIYSFHSFFFNLKLNYCRSVHCKIV